MRWVDVVLSGSTMALVACGGPSPVGTWEGSFAIESTDGEAYVNEMTIDDDGGEVTLYSLLPSTDPETGDEVQLIGQSDFDATWSRSEDVTFLLLCAWDDCVYNPSMDCLFEDDGSLHCDMTPDFYGDDELALVWQELE